MFCLVNDKSAFIAVLYGTTKLRFIRKERLGKMSRRYDMDWIRDITVLSIIFSQSNNFFHKRKLSYVCESWR